MGAIRLSVSSQLRHSLRYSVITYSKQGRINHWANRANARGLEILGASPLDIKRLLS